MEKRTQQGKLTNLEIASFCSEMAMILKSGISSLEGVDLLREDAQTKAEKELLDEIYQSVMDTGRLDQALEETKSDIGWGSQILSYVLDDSRIKDLRTGVDTRNTQSVLDGDLDKFIEASLKSGL